MTGNTSIIKQEADNIDIGHGHNFPPPFSYIVTSLHSQRRQYAIFRLGFLLSGASCKVNLCCRSSVKMAAPIKNKDIYNPKIKVVRI